MKIKCKQCQTKFNVQSAKDIECSQTNCPQKDYAATKYEELEFKDFPKAEFEIIEEINVPEAAPVVLNSQDDFDREYPLF